MMKYIIKLLGWETIPIATGKPTGISHTCNPSIKTTLSEFFYERIHSKIQKNESES